MLKGLRSQTLCRTIAVALLVAALAGCGGTGDETTTDLVVWQTETDPAAKEALEQLATSFERSNPGVDVTIESVPWGSLSERLAAAIRNNDPPDIAHLQPFMTYGLVEQGQLSPIDDVIRELEATHGPILPAVRDLQLFDGRRYGLAYAVGVTGWTFDTRKAGGLALPYPQDSAGTITEDALFNYLRQVRARNRQATVLLPGGTPFFMEQLFGELVANAGGRLYDPATRQFLFTSEPARRALRFFVRLRQAGLVTADWQGQQYVDQFGRLASPGSVFLTPVTYARASVAIERTLGDNRQEANSNVFRFMSPPTNQRNGQPVATIDAEPFVIFQHTDREPAPRGQTKRQLAAAFLRAFYARDNYLRFVRAVPIHLTPVFERLAEDAAYTRWIHEGWLDWHRHTLAFLRDPNLTRPILVPGPNASTLAQDLRNPYLLQLQAQGVIARAVTQAMEPNADVDAILANAQAAATRIVEQPIQPAASR